MIKNLLHLVVIMTLLSCTACGGGSGGNSTTTTAQKTTAILKINVTGYLPAGSAISGVGFTLTLPSNVTPKMSNGAIDPGVVALSGTFANSTISPLIEYTPTAAATPGSLSIGLTSSTVTGITVVGEVATIHLQLANSSTPTVADFPLSAVSVIDLGANPIGVMGASVASVTLQ